MTLITRVFKASDNSLVAEGTPQRVAYDKFIAYLPTGTTTLGEYYAVNHDDSGVLSDSIKVNLLPYDKKAQAPAPDADVADADSATSSESDSAQSSATSSASSASSTSSSSKSESSASNSVNHVI